MNIKCLKPSKKSRYQQGYINPQSCKKLIDYSKPIIFRSSYEKKFVHWLESSSQVVRWGSECLCIPYTYIDGQIHKYYPDYYLETVDGNRIVVEIKPFNQTQAPIQENSWAQKEWVKNTCKWRAAQEFCEARGLQFKILTENTISKL